MFEKFQMNKKSRTIILNAMNEMIETVARSLGYIVIEDKETTEDPDNPFWGNAWAIMSGVYHKQVWGLPVWEDDLVWEHDTWKEGGDAYGHAKRQRHIEIDFHFEKPRINIRLPRGQYGEECALFMTVDANLRISEVQIFGETTIDILPTMKNMLRDLITKYERQYDKQS